jgi:hypothetical protein
VEVAASDPYRLIESTAARAYRRTLFELLSPVAPPAAALAVAQWLGVLPIELGAAAFIVGALVLLEATGLTRSRTQAARFLDETLGGKDHFLTLATAAAGPALMPLVEADARAIAARHATATLSPPRKRPVVLSAVLSICGVLLLWSLPRVASLASTGAGDLDRIAAELAAAGDVESARAVADASRALRDPKLSDRQKLEKVQEAMRRIDAQEKSQAAGSGSSGGGGDKKGERQQQQGKQSKGQAEQGEGAGAQKQAQSGANGGAGQARGEAKQELSKIAGELAGQQQQGKNEKPEKQQSGKQQQQPSGGGIQGPESGAEKRKGGDGDSAGNQPGKNPDKPGGNEKSGGNDGASQAERNGEQPNQPGQANAAKGGGGEGEGSGQRSSSRPDAKPAERYYKPGEGGEGGIRDGQYVRVRVPDENQALPGTELVAKPGDASPQTPYGNAPLPAAGAPGEVGAEQPVPLEYRDAFKGEARRER